MDNNTLLLVLTGLIVKHFFCDFPLQTIYMLGKNKSGTAWIAPLAAHCFTHTCFSLIIFLLAAPHMAWVCILEFGIHFGVDRMKAIYRLDPGVWAPEKKARNLAKYYRAFGLDQLAHYLTYVGMVYISVNF